MAIDFSLPPEVTAVRERVRAFLTQEVAPAIHSLKTGRDLAAWRPTLQRLREKAKADGLWAPHMPREWGGMGLGPMAMAFVSAECGRSEFGAYILNCHAPDEGNMHTLLHFGTPEQKQKYLRPLVDGECRSCFAMTEPEVAGSDPTGIRTQAVKHGDRWVIDGHKWFISGAHGARFAIVIAKTDPDANPPQARNSAFLVETDNPGWKIVRDIETMAGKGNHCEIRLENCVVSDAALFGGRGQGHRLGQVRLGPARLAHCMRWIGNAEVALEMSAKRALERELHGGVLADKQGIQWQLAESTHGALPVQADGAARGLPDRERPALPARGLDVQAPRRGHAVARDRSRDPGARRARLLDRHRAREHAAPRALGAAGRRRRRGPPLADRPPPARGLPARRQHPERHRGRAWL